MKLFYDKTSLYKNIFTVMVCLFIIGFVYYHSFYLNTIPEILNSNENLLYGIVNVIGFVFIYSLLFSIVGGIIFMVSLFPLIYTFLSYICTEHEKNIISYVKERVRKSKYKDYSDKWLNDINDRYDFVSYILHMRDMFKINEKAYNEVSECLKNLRINNDEKYDFIIYLIGKTPEGVCNHKDLGDESSEQERIEKVLNYYIRDYAKTKLTQEKINENEEKIKEVSKLILK